MTNANMPPGQVGFLVEFSGFFVKIRVFYEAGAVHSRYAA